MLESSQAFEYTKEYHTDRWLRYGGTFSSIIFVCQRIIGGFFVTLPNGITVINTIARQTCFTSKGNGVG